MRKPDDFRILAEQISKEPLAQLVRQSDVDLFNVLRWTIFAMINAEELGVTAANVSEMSKAADPDVRRLLGVTPGNGKALGLDEAWAANVIKAVGNYGETFDRNVGARSPLKLPRGLNRLWTTGGLMFAPPLR
jgi:general L-amino acid transport system substrate-binding protein